MSACNQPQDYGRFHKCRRYNIQRYWICKMRMLHAREQQSFAVELHSADSVECERWLGARDCPFQLVSSVILLLHWILFCIRTKQEHDTVETYRK